MKAVILAGGLGTRISEETSIKPKPMVEIGGMPILWHIMKIYSFYGINDFIICCGYKGAVIKKYYSDYYLHSSDISISLENNEVKIDRNRGEPWNITLLDTGDATMTGGRLKRVSSYLKDEEAFCFTYGDGLSDINIKDLIDFHTKQKTFVTLTAVFPPGRFGSLTIPGDNKVTEFKEKPRGDGARINGGFFVLSPKVLDYIDDDNTSWEDEPLEKLSSIGEVSAFKHDGFWQPMDTLRDKKLLEGLWSNSKALWKKW